VPSQNSRILTSLLTIMRLVILFFYLLLIILTLAFASLNAEIVNLHLYWWALKLPLAFIMIVSLGLGLVLGALVFIGKYLTLGLKYKKLSHQVGLLEKEIKNLRTIPIQDAH
jgi:putative membrane protein